MIRVSAEASAHKGARRKSLDELKIDDRYKRAVKRAAAAIREVLGDNLVELLLYGSVAREQPREFSDVDILAIVREPVSWELRWEIIGRLQPVELDEAVVIMVAYVPIQRFRREAAIGFGWLYEVERDGVPL